MASRVVLVGLGHISSSHLRALEDLTSVASVVGVDPSPPPGVSFRQVPFRVHRELRPGLCEGADLVVVATPTASHAAVVAAVRADDASVPILVEKPAAASREDADRLLAAEPAVHVIFHLGFASEVLWATGFCKTERSRLGDVVACEAWFGNPYAHDRDHRTASLTNSWLDSGINALSVIGRFAIPSAVESFRSLPDLFSTFEARLRFRSGDPSGLATIVTTWQAAEYSQRVRLRFAGGIELVLDHIAGAATVYEDGKVAEMFTRTDTQLRLDVHYANFYRDYFGTGKWQYPEGAGRDLHGLLFSAMESLG